MLRNDLYKSWALENDKWGFEIISGDFLGVIVEIQDIKFTEEGSSQVDVDYHVINKPETLTQEDVSGELFTNTFQLIINDILTEAIQGYERDKQ